MNLPDKKQVVNVGTFLVIFLYLYIAVRVLIRFDEPSVLIKFLCGIIFLSVPILLFKHIKSQFEKYIEFLWDDKEDSE